MTTLTMERETPAPPEQNGEGPSLLQWPETRFRTKKPRLFKD